MSFYRDTLRTARKEHKCELCGAIIQKGEKYHDKADNVIYGGNEIFRSKQCKKCQPVLEEFVKSKYYDSDYGYTADYISEWWTEEKCDSCKNRLLSCEPDGCDSISECGNFKNGKCEDAHCDEMTHYCRCEKFEVDSDQKLAKDPQQEILRQ